MATALTALKVSDWDTMKRNAGIGKTPALKALLGQSAAVGPAIDAFSKSYKAWAEEVSAKKETMATATKYFMAVAKLKEALEKFEKTKDLSDAAVRQNPAVKPLRDSVAAWRKEATEMAKNQAGYINTNKDKLNAGGKDKMGNILDNTGTTGR